MTVHHLLRIYLVLWNVLLQKGKRCCLCD